MSNNRYAVILAAGKGTRMQSKLYKVLHKVCDRTMVELVLDSLNDLEMQEVITVVGHGAERVKEVLGNRTKFVLQAEQLGTAHAVKVAKDELKNKIISGQFASGDKFYTEAELIAMYDVSSITVVRALNDLAKDGYIVRQQGKGTFVSRARKHKLVEFSDVEIFETKDDKVTVLSIERGNKLEYLDKLGLRGDQFYYKIERIRQTNDVTYIYHTSYIPEQYINANYPNLDYYSSIYTRFKLDYRIHMSDEHFEEINEIAFPTPEHAASVLGIDTQFPTVFQTKTTKLEATGQVLAYSETYKRADYYKIKFISCNRGH